MVSKKLEELKRDPITVLLLGTFTLNIYTLVWLYKVQKFVSQNSRQKFLPFWMLLSPFIAVALLVLIFICLGASAPDDVSGYAFDRLLGTMIALALVVLTAAFCLTGWWIRAFAGAVAELVGKPLHKKRVFLLGIFALLPLFIPWMSWTFACWATYVQSSINKAKEAKQIKQSFALRGGIIIALVVTTMVTLAGAAFVMHDERDNVSKSQAQAIAYGEAVKFCMKHYSVDDCKNMKLDSVNKQWYGPTDGDAVYAGTWLIDYNTGNNTITVSLDIDGSTEYVSDKGSRLVYPELSQIEGNE